MRIKPTPQQLVAFLRVVETGSFSRAAGTLGVSQPTLSRTIKAVEYSIGARLLNRDTRNVELTSVGAELRLIATRLVKEFDSAFNELTQFVEGQRGQITIAALPSISAALLPRSILRFRETNPRRGPGQPVTAATEQRPRRSGGVGLNRASGTLGEAGLQATGAGRILPRLSEG